MHFKATEKLNDLLQKGRELTASLHSTLGSLSSLTILNNSGTYHSLVNFIIQEFVPRDVYKIYEERSSIFIDTRVLWTADAIRDYFNSKVFINNWCFGGKLQYRGFRPHNSVVGSLYSQHRFGRAIDFDIEGVPAEQVRIEIINNRGHPAFQFIRGIELDVDWVHIDTRNSEKLLQFKP